MNEAIKKERREREKERKIYFFSVMSKQTSET